MNTSASIAQEFYKVQELWKEIDCRRDWRLAIWIAEYQDVEIIDKFIEIERSPLGIFDDLFFRFDTEYTGDPISFEKALWKEYTDWFIRPEQKELDILEVLDKEGYLVQEYLPIPNKKADATCLWKEMLRFRSCLKDASDKNFCIYIPPTLPDGEPLTEWFKSILDSGIPEGIRIVTIDYAQQRKVKIHSSHQVVHLYPKLDMMAAMQNEISKGCDSGDTVNPEERFKLQVYKVLQLSSEGDEQSINKEVNLLLSLAEETGSPITLITGRMIAAQAFYTLNKDEQCLVHSEKAIMDAEKLMVAGDKSGYPVWRSTILLKAAILLKDKKRKEAIELYEQLAVKASTEGDAFYVMEGYRLSGYLYYELNKKETAFETTLLALAAGEFLSPDMRRQSTFLYAAALALELGRKVRPEEDMEILENQLKEWLGDDWQELLKSKGMKQVTTRRKASIFNR